MIQRSFNSFVTQNGLLSFMINKIGYSVEMKTKFCSSGKTAYNLIKVYNIVSGKMMLEIRSVTLNKIRLRNKNNFIST